MASCQVKSCPNRRGKTFPKRSYFRIPEPRNLAERERANKWLHNIGNGDNVDNFKFSGRKVVCEDHFSSDCIEVNLQAKLLGYKPHSKSLVPGALPTIFKHKHYHQTNMDQCISTVSRNNEANVHLRYNLGCTTSWLSEKGAIPFSSMVAAFWSVYANVKVEGKGHESIRRTTEMKLKKEKGKNNSEQPQRMKDRWTKLPSYETTLQQSLLIPRAKGGVINERDKLHPDESLSTPHTSDVTNVLTSGMSIPQTETIVIDETDILSNSAYSSFDELEDLFSDEDEGEIDEGKGIEDPDFDPTNESDSTGQSGSEEIPIEVVPPGSTVHIDEETGEKRFECDTCHKMYSRKGSVRQHVRKHGEKKYKCEICERLFFTSHQLKEHIKVHASQRDYICKECGKAFKRKDALKVHSRIHSGEKRYECKKCGDRFVQLNSLNYHMKNHTAEKTFECKVCSNTFHSVASLKSHTKIHT